MLRQHCIGCIDVLGFRQQLRAPVLAHGAKLVAHLRAREQNFTV